MVGKDKPKEPFKEAMDEVIVQPAGGLKPRFVIRESISVSPSPSTHSNPKHPGILFPDHDFDQRHRRSAASSLGRSSSDSDISMGSTISGKTNWHQLAQKMRDIRDVDRSLKDQERIHALREKKRRHDKKRRHVQFRLFWRRFSCLFLGTMFFRHRHRFITLLEVIFPIFLSVCIFAAFTSGISWRKAYTERKIAEATGKDLMFDDTEIHMLLSKFRKVYTDGAGRSYIAFSPRNALTIDLMNRVLRILMIHNQNEVLLVDRHSSYGAVGVSSYSELMEHCLLHRTDKNAHRSPVGIEFKFSTDKSKYTNLPLKLSFSISTFSPAIAGTGYSHPYVVPPRKEDWQPPYIETGFLGLQYAIQTAYMDKIFEETSKKYMEKLTYLDSIGDINGKVAAQRQKPKDPVDFPQLIFKTIYTPNFYDSNVRTLIRMVICMTICMAYMGLSFFIVRQIVVETQSGIKDLLTMHSLPKYFHWVILLAHTMLLRTITSLGITASLYIDYGEGAIMSRSDISIIFLIIWLHVVSLSSFNFFIGTVFTSVNYSGVYSVCLCFFSYFLPYCLYQSNLLSVVPNIILSVVFPNWAFTNAIYEVVNFECDDSGLNWQNAHQVSSSDHLSCAVTMIILAGSAIMYFLAAVARDLLFNRQSVLGNTWYRIIQKCCGDKRMTRSGSVQVKKPSRRPSDLDEDDNEYKKPLIFESEDLPHDNAVIVRHVSKMYGRHRLVLDNINLDFAHGEITILLGQSDSGKSTLIQIIAGMVEPTTGHITINGFDVNKQSDKAHEFMGLCPQDVRVFNLLTVKEHLTLCYQLRGLSHKDSGRQAGSLMTLLRLVNVMDRVPSALTDDEKRKLGIAMCLVDKPVVMVILLDEPTLGMETLARHEIWDILKHLKQEGHSIILTTNMMDEAEYLADRVALLSHGKLICYGRPQFLKEQYDTGYFLKIVANPILFNLETFQKQLAVKHFGEPLRDAPKKSIQDQRNFVLVLPKRFHKRYPEFLDDVESSKIRLGIVSYGCQSVTLSDIFINICEMVSSEADAPDVYARKNSMDEWVNTLGSEVPVVPPKERVKPSFMHQFPALFRKRIHCFTLQYFLMIVWEIIIPIFFIWIVVWHSHVFVLPNPMPVKREFKLETFSKLKAYYRLSGEYAHSQAFGWKIHVKELLGKYGDKLEPKDHILRTVHANLFDDRANKSFQLEKRMIGLELRKAYGKATDQFVMYFASGSVHSPPLVLNLMGNILLRALTYMTEQPEHYSILAANIPFPTTILSPFDLPSGDSTCVVFALTVSLCIGFFCAIYSFPRSERLTGMKFLQLMTGVRPFTYWLAHYVFDFVISLFLTAIISFTFLLDTRRTFWSFNTIFVLAVFAFLFMCWSLPPWIYVLSTIFTTKLQGTGFIVVIHMVFATVPFVLFEWALLGSSNAAVQYFRLLTHLFPPYTLTTSFRTWFNLVSKRSSCLAIPNDIAQMCKISAEHTNLYKTQFDMVQIYEYVVKKDTNLSLCCEKICVPTKSCFEPPPYLSWKAEAWEQPKLISFIFAFVIQGILYWLILIICEQRMISRCMQSIIAKFLKSHKDLKEDKKLRKKLQAEVWRERQRVGMILGFKKMPPETAIICHELTKSYTSRMVLNNVSLEVQKGEICGILGGGGSGKTIMIQILAGGVVPSRGTAHIGKWNLRDNPREYLRNIGYCPQSNALFENFSGIEMMELFGKLKGVPPHLLAIHVKKWLQVLGLSEVGKELCRNYSNSMRRRLCGAMCLIGGSPVLLLDEPTAGIDPLARQRFWSVIKHMATLGHAVVFSSYNVEECSTVCSRLVVLAEGNVQCIGSPEDLREKFSRGYSLLIRIRFDVLTPMEIVSSTVGRVQDLKKTIEEKFKHATLRDEQDNLLLYFIRDTKLTWAYVFRMAEEIRAKHLEIFDRYFISQASLEDVYILLTNRYRVMDKPRKMESTYPGELSQYEAETAALEEATKAMKITD